MTQSTGTTQSETAFRGSVLTVMKAHGNRKVIGEFLESQRFSVLPASSETEIDDYIVDKVDIKLALVDVSGLGAQVWRICEKLQKSTIPFIVLSPPQAFQKSSNSIAYGALSVLQKPLAKQSLLELLKSLTP